MITRTKAQESAVESFEDSLFAAYADFVRKAATTGMDSRDREIALGRYLNPLGRKFLSDRHQETLSKR